MRATSRPTSTWADERTTELRIQSRSVSSTSAPECADDNFVLVKRVVQMAGGLTKVDAAKTSNSSLSVGRSGARQPGQDPEDFFKLRDEHVDVDSVFEPPLFLLSDVLSCRPRKSDLAGTQRDRSSLRISWASTRRPAATSTSDSRRASWSAARSASSSQSPGSRDRSCNSVPSGKSVGSSTISRPARTRALMVMATRIALRRPPNERLQPSVLGAIVKRRG